MNAGRGFTLLELLVVIVIVALLSAGVALTLPEREDPRLLQRQSEQLTAWCRLARNQSVYRGGRFGAVFTEGSVRILRYADQGWETLAEGPFAHALPLEEGLHYHVLVGGIEVDIHARNESPQIVFLDDGQVSPFEIRISSDAGESMVLEQSLRLRRELETSP